MNTIRLNTKLIKSLSDVLYMPSANLIDVTGIKSTTWYTIKKKPDDITVQQLLAIANGLHIPVRRFFSTDNTDIIGRRDDYIVESYVECSYSSSVLQELVNNHSNITWKKASDATGITYDNLRKSLLAVRKTPVSRFLTTCEAFGIDPFTILIDPNPENKRNGSAPRGSSTREKESIRSDIESLRREVSNLNSAVEDLAKKYEELSRKQEDLSRRFLYDISKISDSSILRAADTSDEYKKTRKDK